MANEGIETSKVSIVMPLYNAEKYVKEAIQSVICQSHQNWELFVIDDCSTDNSYSIVKEIATDDPRIHLLQNDKNFWNRQNSKRRFKKSNR
jgi:teichuronic acid biosynthesis glycosyltransferase TuaG